MLTIEVGIMSEESREEKQDQAAHTLHSQSAIKPEELLKLNCGMVAISDHAATRPASEGG